MSLATSIAEARVLLIEGDAPDATFRVDKSGASVEITMTLVDREGWYRAHGYGRGLPSHMKKPGYVDGSLTLVRTGASIPDQCQANAQALSREVFGSEVTVWAVKSVLLGPKLQGIGLGKELYARGFEAVAPAIIVPDKCQGGRTSQYAANVWQSLARRYPSRGKGLDQVAIAVR